jgi:hypothetical protein
MIGRGLWIAASLLISTATAKGDLACLLAKLGARDRVQLVVAACEAGLVPPSLGRCVAATGVIVSGQHARAVLQLGQVQPTLTGHQQMGLPQGVVLLLRANGWAGRCPLAVAAPRVRRTLRRPARRNRRVTRVAASRALPFTNVVLHM